MVRFKITNLKEFEATFTSQMGALGAGVVQAVQDDAVHFLKGVSKKVERSREYTQLMNDQDIRGILGMPAPGRKFGSDTDGPNLLFALSKFKVIRLDVKRGRHRRFRIKFPSLQWLERTLTRNISKLERGIPKPGLRTSWFRWWEFGDRGEMEGQTILKSNLAGYARKRSKSTKNKRDLLKLIREKSRSRSGLQIMSSGGGGVTGFQGVGLVTRVYAEFAQKFKSRMAKAVKKYASKANVDKRFFARVRIG